MGLVGFDAERVRCYGRSWETISAASLEVCQFKMQSKEKRQERHTLPHGGNAQSHRMAFGMEATIQRTRLFTAKNEEIYKRYFFSPHEIIGLTHSLGD